MTQSSRIRVGIVGYGVVGTRRHHFLDQNPETEVVAVCDQRFEDVGTLKSGVKCFQNYKQLLEQEMDAVCVCMPNEMAAEVTMAALECERHVLCEKPPGRSLAEIRSVIDVEKRYPKLVLKYGFNHRYHDSVRDALKVIASGELGRVHNMRGVYGKSKVVPFTGNWRAERKFAGGGILLDQGIHMVDLMRLFAGEEFVEVKSFVSNSYWQHDVEDNAYALLRDGRGRVAMLHSTATQWQHRFSLDIALDQGYLELRGILSGSKSYGAERLAVGRRDDAAVGSSREEVTNYLHDNSWRDEIAEFVDVIQGKRKTLSGTSHDAYETMKLVTRIYHADSDWRQQFSIEDPE